MTTTTFTQLRQRLEAGSDRVWWCYRIVQFVGTHFDETAISERETALDCFITLAKEDPAWTLESLGNIMQQNSLSKLLSGDALRKALAELPPSSAPERIMVRAQLLVVSADWGRSALFRDAWQELLRIPEAERDAAWRTVALRPTAVVDYPAFRDLAERHIAAIASDFNRSLFLPKVIEVAWRNGDWSTYEAWTAAYRALPAQLHCDHDRAVLLSMEGARALREGRVADTERAMRDLLETATRLTFLSNPDVSMLPNALHERGLFPALCDAFASLVKERDWRLLAL